MQQHLIDQLLKAARQSAAQHRVPVTIAVVDTGGHIRAILRQEGCSYFALESSRQKAVTSSQLNIPSKIVGELSEKFPALAASFQRNADVLGLPGGVPIRWQGLVVGGLGIAGGNFEQDHQIAEEALTALQAEEDAPRTAN